jgi:hypothetical protein
MIKLIQDEKNSPDRLVTISLTVRELNTILAILPSARLDTATDYSKEYPRYKVIEDYPHFDRIYQNLLIVAKQLNAEKENIKI